MVFLLALLMSGELTHLLYGLNPQLPVRAKDFLAYMGVLYPFFFIFYAFLYGLIRRRKTWQVWFPLGTVSFLIILFTLHLKLNPLFLDPAMVKIMEKERMALFALMAIFFLSAFLSKKYPHLQLYGFLLGCFVVHLYQYQRRDTWVVRHYPPFSSLYQDVATPPLILLNFQEGSYESFLSVTEQGTYPYLSQLRWSSCLARLAPTGFPEKPFEVTLWTGAYPYRHRIFFNHPFSSRLFPQVDLFFYGFNALGLADQPHEITQSSIPPFWQILQRDHYAVQMKEGLPCLKPLKGILIAWDVPFDLEALESFSQAFIEGDRQGATLVFCLPEEKGWLLFYGPGIQKDSFIPFTQPVDFVPTLYFLVNHPIPRILDGQVLYRAFTQTYLETHPILYSGRF